MPSASPLPWQTDPIRVVTYAIAHRRSVLDASDTGTGKTFVTLFAAKAAGRRAAVICPKSVIAQWEEAAALVGVLVGPLLAVSVKRQFEASASVVWEPEASATGAAGVATLRALVDSIKLPGVLAEVRRVTHPSRGAGRPHGQMPLALVGGTIAGPLGGRAGC